MIKTNLICFLNDSDAGIDNGFLNDSDAGIDRSFDICLLFKQKLEIHVSTF